MRLKQIIIAATFVGATALAEGSQAATPLAWSLAGGNISACTNATSCTAENRRVISNVADYGYGENNSLALNASPFGRVEVMTGPGEGAFALPELKALAQGGPGDADEFARSLAFSDAVQRYRWDGVAAIDLSVSTFQGSLNLTNSGAGQFHAALHIIDSTLDDDPANGDHWYFGNQYLYGGAGSGCGSPGAIASADTGGVSAVAVTNLTLTPSCGASTFRLDPGEEFFVWARLDILHFGPGVTDATHTFTVQLAPDTPDTIVAALQENLTVLPTYSPFAVPEPSTWALLIAGFGAVGGALRRRTRRLAAVRPAA